MAQDPIEEYQRRAREREEVACSLARRDRSLSTLRLGLALTFALMAWLVFAAELIGLEWLGLPVVVFVAVALHHERVAERLARARRAAALYQAGLSRLAGDWMGKGNPGEAFREPGHLYAEDLDLFGRGSLFELLCAARTEAGEAQLARWLLEPGSPAAIAARQEAVAELRDRLDLREDVELLGHMVRGGFDPAGLVRWGEAAGEPLPDWSRAAAFALPAAVVVGLVAWPLGAGTTPLLAALIVEVIVARTLHHRIERILDAARSPAGGLGVLVELLARLEREPFQAPLLLELEARLGSGERGPRRAVAALARLLEGVDARLNMVFAPFAFVLLWSLHYALAIERWRARHGARLGDWLAATGEMEALLSLSRHAFENPADPFPVIVDEPSAMFEAEGLGHPFLAGDRAVANDLVLGGELRLLVVSGSNMSGKSTLLRSVGVNAVLAFAGAPVRARRLRLSPFAIGASIRIQDSLQDGSSRFYAEIRRLSQVLDQARGPLLFLLDEVLNGTNSHDRRIGAEAVLRALVARGAIGLVTTHDLALTAIGDGLGPLARNAHFEDQIEGARIHFDYRLRPGILTRGNALALMRAVGLEV